MNNYRLVKIFFLFIVVLLHGCKNDINTDFVAVEEQLKLDGDNARTFSLETREERPTVLGKKKDNPFSVANMQMALDSLIALLIELDDDVVMLKSATQLEIAPTDLYVRFLPKDSVGYFTLMADTTLTLFDFPLDYEIVQLGEYFIDPDLDSEYTYYYTTVKPGYIAPNNLEFQVLSELFIVENSEYYTEEIITEEEIDLKSTGKPIIDQNLCNALYVMSFVLTGNEAELNLGSDDHLKATYQTCKRRCVWKACWTTCDTYYKPDGFIRVNTPSGPIGLKGVKVRMWRWFTYTDTKTSAAGYYMSNSTFNKILIGNNVNYKIIFEGQNINNKWTFNRTISGVLCLWRDSYGLGSHSPNGHTMMFDSISDYWGRCVLNNAIFDYVARANVDKISFPPAHLDIADKVSNDLTSSAPLLKNHYNFSLIKANPLWGSYATLFGYSLFGSALPDLILRYTKNNLSDYNRITAIAWHELTHASQLQRMITEKGTAWASDYWSTMVYQQASNNINTNDSYGAKGDQSWQIIALAEGWANYREELLARSFLNEPNYVGTNHAMLSNYVNMFKQLRNLGCSYSNLEKSLCTYSISGFKSNLISYYPNISAQITNVIKNYE